METEDERLGESAPAVVDAASLTLGARHGLGGVLSSLFGTEVAPEVFGRYRIVRRLGAGAFGEVYEARDVTLGRNVAIKILRPLGSTDAIERLRREARAMAAVDDPALVEVFEVGTIDGRDFIAMELVRGTTLARWSADHPPGAAARFAAALHRLIGAAGGLAAAHRSGLVHRDFKPANVLVTDDGVAKVADFGLARSDDTPAEPTSADAGESTSLTRTGAVMGTPRYMAPEQHRGVRADARSDQFAFAVSAWEVIFGVPPFVGRTAIELLDAIERGPPAPPEVRGVPSWVAPVLQRGLAVDPAARFESVEALVRALDRASKRRRRRVVIAVSVVGALGLAGWLREAAAPAPDTRCDRSIPTAELAAVWSPERQAVLAEGLRTTGVAWADATSASLDEAMRRWGDRWIDRHVQSCRATWHERSATEADLDRRIACLREGLATADALLTRLATPSKAQAERTLAAVDGLPDPAECESPETIADDDEALEDSVAAARAAHLAGDYEAAATMASALVDQSADGSREAARGDALFVLGLARGEQAPGAMTGVDALDEAHAIAVALDQPRRATRRAYAAATAYAHAAQLETAAKWLRHAQVALGRVVGARAELAAGIARATCQLREAQGRLDDALVSCREAVALLDGADGIDDSLRWSVRMSLASTLLGLGRVPEARDLLTVLHDEAVTRLGAMHPRAGGAQMNLGLAAHRLGELDRAAEAIRGATEVFAATYGPDHAWVVSGWLNLAAVESAGGDLDRAAATLQRALDTAGDRRDAQTARVMLNLADLHRRQGRLDDALRELDRVADLEAATVGPDHVQTAHTHHTRALVLLALRRLDEARAEIDRALDLRKGSPDAPENARAWAVRGRIDEVRGKPLEAIAAAREAERIFAGSGGFDDTRAGNLLRWLDLTARQASAR